MVLAFDWGAYCGSELASLLPDLRVGESAESFRSSSRRRSDESVLDEVDAAYYLTWGTCRCEPESPNAAWADRVVCHLGAAIGSRMVDLGGVGPTRPQHLKGQGRQKQRTAAALSARKHWLWQSDRDLEQGSGNRH